uniref:Uncharacterized protein n=1 Tax=Rhizophagus irregularis (strain DAOM 181602 / DAOM 197198 / MUCL 43194) TaxID=747089 RepID=U9USS8_RHIID
MSVRSQQQKERWNLHGPRHNTETAKSVKPSKIGNAVKKEEESTEITLTYTSSQY